MRAGSGELSSARGWEYAYEKGLKEELERLRDALENSEPSTCEFLRGQIRGIRVAISDLSEVRQRFNVDQDQDREE